MYWRREAGVSDHSKTATPAPSTCGRNGTMTSPHLTDDLNGRIRETDAPLSNDDLNPERKGDEGTSTVQVVVDQDRWHYYHLSTP
jgi:hypothetical protein